MDIVYIVGADPNDYFELRYSIRSMQKHLDQIGKLFVVGVCPSWLKAIHIPVSDLHLHNAARNLYEKILAACNDKRVSKKFICCSDDYFLQRNFSTETFPYFYDNDLQFVSARVNVNGGYKAYVDNTLHALEARNLPTKFFNVHAPIIYEKKLFREVMQAYDWNIRKGYISKSLYCNSLKIEGVPGADLKFHTPKTITSIARYKKDAPFYSTNEHAVNAEMKLTWEQDYPQPSRWETDIKITNYETINISPVATALHIPGAANE